MKKVGVLTFHRPYNFGAVLQAYALHKTIQNEGYDCKVVDYRNLKIEKWFHNKTMKVKVKNLAKYFLYHSYSVELKKKAKRFDAFTKENVNLSKVYPNADGFKDDFDAVVVGSDQVWNLEMTGGDMNFFLPYEKGAKKLSYAASFGKGYVPEQYLEGVKNCLNSFESLYAREGDGADLITKITGKKGESTADPTLLLNKTEWQKVAKEVKTDKKYILLYLVAQQTHAVEIAKKMANKCGYEVIHVDAPRNKIEGVRSLVDVGPSEFLYLINNAECVVTTSFHGLILSINHNTPFLFELSNLAKNTNSRLNEVNETYSLEKYRIVSNNLEDYAELEYDWDKINEIVERERRAGKDRLKKSLNE